MPATGQITEFKMPDPEARDPHTGIFDKNGTLFFTLQQSNMLGRMVPSTGEIKLITLTTLRSLPYGLKQDSKGTVWVAYNGTTRLAAWIRSRWRSASLRCRKACARDDSS